MARKGQFKLTPAQVKTTCEAYVEECRAKDKIPLIAELCLKLDISDSTLEDYRKDPRYEKAIKRVDKEQEVALLRKGVTDNKPVFPIFLLKAKHGYIEQQKVDITSGGNTLGVVMLPSKDVK